MNEPTDEFILGEWVKAKIRALRNSFCKAKKPPPSGSARKNPTKRTQWLLEKLQFLTPHVATRASISNIDLVSKYALKKLRQLQSIIIV